jgi:DNA-directed RNA polymerase subunit H (RpoH/RPB5)
MEKLNLSEIQLIDNISKSQKIIKEMMSDRNFVLDTIKDEDDSMEFKNDLDHRTIVLFIKEKKDFTEKKKNHYYNINKIKDNDIIIFVICFLENNKSLSIKYLNYENNYTQVFHIKNLLFNITKNKYVPEHIKLNNTQIQELSSIFNKDFKDKIAKIYTNDPMCKYLFAKENDILKIKRYRNESNRNESMEITPYSSYRKCINNNFFGVN